MLGNMEHGCLIERPVIIPPPLDNWVVLCRQCGKRHMGLSIQFPPTHCLSQPLQGIRAHTRQETGENPAVFAQCLPRSKRKAKVCEVHMRIRLGGCCPCSTRSLSSLDASSIHIPPAATRWTALLLSPAPEYGSELPHHRQSGQTDIADCFASSKYRTGWQRRVLTTLARAEPCGRKRFRVDASPSGHGHLISSPQAEPGVQFPRTGLPR